MTRNIGQIRSALSSVTAGAANTTTDIVTQTVPVLVHAISLNATGVGTWIEIEDQSANVIWRMGLDTITTTNGAAEMWWDIAFPVPIRSNSGLQIHVTGGSVDYCVAYEVISNA